MYSIYLQCAFSLCIMIKRNDNKIVRLACRMPVMLACNAFVQKVSQQFVSFLVFSSHPAIHFAVF